VKTYTLVEREETEVINTIRLRILQLERRFGLLGGDLQPKSSITDNVVYNDSLDDIVCEIKTCKDIIRKMEK
jgi:hypothetical protein